MTQAAVHNQYPMTAVQLPESRVDELYKPLHNQMVTLDTEAALYSPGDIGVHEYTNQALHRSIVGELALNGNTDCAVETAIIKVSSSFNYPSKYYLAGLETDDRGNIRAREDKYWVPLEDNRPITIGRGSTALNGEKLVGKAFEDQISRTHATVTYADGNIIIEDRSAHGSFYKGTEAAASVQDEDYNYQSSHTATAEELARLRGMLKEHGGTMEFEGRPTIGRDTFPIDGHVDIRSWVAGGEAIVVDSKKYPAEFKVLSERFDQEFSRVMAQPEAPGKSREEQVLLAIYRTVDASLSYDLAYVNQETELVRQQSPDHRKTALNNYLIDGKGVCRHMALTASWLGGEAVQRGLLRGRFTTEVNQSTEGNGAHEWARFEPEEGDPYILDIAQHYFGKLSDTLAKAPEGHERWGYFRNKEERDGYRQSKLGAHITSTAGYLQLPVPGKIIDSSDIPR